MTLSLAAVFLPLVFMTRPDGPHLPRILDHDHRLDLRLRLVSLTLTPLMCVAAAGSSAARARRRPGWSA